MDKKVLVIDSSEFERKKIRSVLEGISSFEIIEISDKDQFQAKFESSNNICLIIIDLSFPDAQSGYEILSTIRKNSNTRNTPIIIMTMLTGPEYKKIALEYSVNDYVLKPYQLKRLENSIRSLVKIDSAPSYDFSDIINITLSFEEYVSKEMKSSLRSGNSLSMIVLSPSEKNKPEVTVPGQYPYLNVTEKIKISLRSTDTIFINKNGDIFITLPSTGAAKLGKVSEKISRILEHEFYKNGMPFYFASVTFPEDGDNLPLLVDNALKKIKSKKTLEAMTNILKDAKTNPGIIYTKYNKK
ncbi:MAG TPA: response regulator [Clostridia bacterium]